MRPSAVQRLTVAETADRYAEMVRAKTSTGALTPRTAEVYVRDVMTFADLAGGERVLDDLSGQDVDAVLLAFARKPDARRRASGTGSSGT
ncbi:integrase, partial [Actinomadura sp. 9N215]